MADKNNKGPTELHTFLPNDNSKQELTTKYNVQVIPKDVEVATSLTDPNRFDPFADRDVDSATSDSQTMTHLLKASLGTGILAMPFAFKSAGLLFGIFATMFVSLVCTHCSYILVKSAHVLYYKTRKTQMGYAEVAQATFSSGPKVLQACSSIARYFIQISLFLTYYGTCSAYTVIIAKNFREVIDHYVYNEVSTTNATFLSNSTNITDTLDIISDQVSSTDIRLIIACLLLPLILLVWVPNLKYLAPISMVANLFMAIGLGITFYYLCQDLSNIKNIPLIGEVSQFPTFFSISIFAIEAIGVVMPLENNMRTPQNFLGVCGVMNKGMSAVTFIYILLGFLGYARYGTDTKDLITSNLDINDIPAQAVKILVALAVFCTFGLQFFVCLDIAWTEIKDRFTKNPLVVNYILRTVMVIGCVLIAIAVPTIAPLIGLIGAFCFSILGILVPVAIEMIVLWDVGFGRFNWIVIKNIVMIIVGILALYFGSRSAIEDIIKEMFSES